MPWQETDPMFERHHFAQDLASGQWTMTELCALRHQSQHGLQMARALPVARGTRPGGAQPRAAVVAQ